MKPPTTTIVYEERSATVAARAERGAERYLIGINPRPSRRTGATADAAREAAGLVVSILARPGGRALPVGAVRHPSPMQFQSSPVPEDGRYPTAPTPMPTATAVSILARPGGRALQPLLVTYTHPSIVFQSSPVPEDGRYLTSAVWVLTVVSFQSSPVPEDGRYARLEFRPIPRTRFNPRPSRRTGATLRPARFRKATYGFNPRPSRRTGATSNLLDKPPRKSGFNPRPSRRTGATLRCLTLQAQ